jgi:RNA polymerase sigma-70 factor (ECF subfamily)
MTWSYAGRGDPVTKRSEVTAVGSSETFEEFYEREYRSVVGLAYALSGSRSGAEDLAQEAFLVAHNDWDRVGTYDRPDVWVRRVVANLSVSVFRRSMVEAKALARIAFGNTPALPELSADDAEFWRAVRSLPRRQAQVIALHYLEDRPVAEVAEIIGTAEGTVKKHLYDGRQALASRLTLEEDDA